MSCLQCNSYNTKDPLKQGTIQADMSPTWSFSVGEGTSIFFLVPPAVLLGNSRSIQHSLVGRAAKETAAGPRKTQQGVRQQRKGEVPRTHICLELLAPLRASEPSMCQGELSKESLEHRNAQRQDSTKSSAWPGGGQVLFTEVSGSSPWGRQAWLSMWKGLE